VVSPLLAHVHLFQEVLQQHARDIMVEVLARVAHQNEEFDHQRLDHAPETEAVGLVKAEQGFAEGNLGPVAAVFKLQTPRISLQEGRHLKRGILLLVARFGVEEQVLHGFLVDEFASLQCGLLFVRVEQLVQVQIECLRDVGVIPLLIALVRDLRLDALLA